MKYQEKKCSLKSYITAVQHVTSRANRSRLGCRVIIPESWDCLPIIKGEGEEKLLFYLLQARVYLLPRFFALFTFGVRFILMRIFTWSSTIAFINWYIARFLLIFVWSRPSFLFRECHPIIISWKEKFILSTSNRIQESIFFC